MKTINIIQQLLPQITNLILAITLLVRGKEILKVLADILSGENGRPSSRRFIAIGAAYVFFHLAMYEIYYTKTANSLTKALLVTMIFLCLGLATLPQLMSLWMSIKGALFGQPDTSNSVTVRKSSEVQITDNTNTGGKP